MTALSAVHLETVQYTAFDARFPINPLNNKDIVVLSEIRDILRNNGLAERFGLTLISKDFNLKSHEVALETSDEAARISTLSVVARDGESRNAIPTNWQFRKGAETISNQCVRACDQNWGHKRLYHSF